MVISTYSIGGFGGYFRLKCHRLLMAIGGHSINGY
jgi:hypothetical protein